MSLDRVVFAAAVFVVAFAFGAEAQTIERWVDEDGRVHYGNVGSTDPNVERSQVGPGRLPDAAPGRGFGVEAEEEERPYADLSDESLSTKASNKRRALQRRVSAAKREIRLIDREVDRLSRARRDTQRRAREELNVSGVAADISSPEEVQLLAKKAAAEKEIAEAKAEYAVMRDEVQRRQGSLPAWWRPLD